MTLIPSGLGCDLETRHVRRTEVQVSVNGQVGCHMIQAVTFDWSESGSCDLGHFVLDRQSFISLLPAQRETESGGKIIKI